MNLRLLLAGAAVVLVAGSAGFIAFRTQRSQAIANSPPESTGSAATTSIEQVRADATPQELAAVERLKTRELQDLYLRAFSLARRRTSTRSDLAPLMHLIARSPSTPQSTDTNATLLHPIHAGFALAILAKAWYIQGPLDLDHKQLALDAVRLSTYNDEVVRLECAMILRVMSEHPGPSPLPEVANKRLEELLKNEFIKSAMRAQITDMEQAAGALK